MPTRLTVQTDPTPESGLQYREARHVTSGAIHLLLASPCPRARYVRKRDPPQMSSHRAIAGTVLALPTPSKPLRFSDTECLRLEDQVNRDSPCAIARNRASIAVRLALDEERSMADVARNRE